MRNTLCDVWQHWHVVWLPPFKSLQNWAHCDAQSWPGSRLRWSSPLASPTRCELRAVICFLTAKGTTLIDIHRQLGEVYGSVCMNVENMQKWVQSSCADVQTSMANSVLVSLRFRLKQLQKWSNKCLKIGMWQFVSCENGSPKSVRVAGEFFDKGIHKMPQCKQKCIDRNGD